MKIRTKLYLSTILIVFILTASLMSIVYFSMVSHFEQQEGNRLKDNVIQSARVVDDFMFLRVTDFNNLSNNPLFSLSTNEVVSDYLSRLIDQYPFYEHIHFVNKNAIIKASSDPKLIGNNILKTEHDIIEEFYSAIKGGNDDVFISDIENVSELEIKKNAPLDIELLSDVVDLKGNKIGVLIGFINVELITKLVSDIDKRTLGDEFAYLVNDQGNILISSNSAAKALQPHPDIKTKGLLKKIKGGENGYIIYVNSYGKKVISAYADLSEYGTEKVGNWSLITTSPYDEIMNPIYQMFYKIFIVASFLTISIILLTFLLSRRFIKPLIELQTAVSNYSINSKPLNLKIGGNDEIGKLSMSFIKMTENLFQSFKERLHAENELKEVDKNLKLQNKEYEILNEKLMEAKEKAEENDRLKSAFLANMSHEIRTPMNSILGFSELLMNHKLSNEKKNKFHDIINSSGKRLMNLINDIIDVSKIDAKELKLNFTIFNLNKTIDQLHRQFSISLQNKNTIIKVVKGVNDNESFVNLDETRLTQVFSNLLENALKFTKEGTIEFGYTFKEGEIHCFVKDSGVGIHKKDHFHIFERFGQSDNEILKVKEGSGLGLSISKGIVELFGGKIWVESEPSKGATFHFTIPKPFIFQEQESSVIHKTVKIEKKPTKTILIAEDEKTNFLYLEAALDGYPFNLIHVENGREAVEIMKNNHNIDLILMDFNMPIMSGIEATEVIRKTNPTIPIIALTAYAMASDKEQAFKIGCTDYISKPVSLEFLLKTINTHIYS